MATTFSREVIEILLILTLLLLPLGFLVSTIMAILKTDGPRRRMSMLILGLDVLFLGLILSLLLFDRIIHYHLENLLAAIAGICAVSAVFCAYLAHTYWPTQLRTVNLPATLGMGGSCLALLLLFLSEI